MGGYSHASVGALPLPLLVLSTYLGKHREVLDYDIMPRPSLLRSQNQKARLLPLVSGTWELTDFEPHPLNIALPA